MQEDPEPPSIPPPQSIALPPFPIPSHPKLPSTLSTTPTLVIPEPGCSWRFALAGVERLKEGCVLQKASNPGEVWRLKSLPKTLIVY